MRELPTYPRCFCCGRENSAGLGLRFLGDENGIKAEFTPGDQHTSFVGVVHGGLLGTVLDEAMGWAASYSNGVMCMAAELKYRYSRPVPVGVKLTVTAELVSSRRNLITARGEIRGPSGELFVRGEGKFLPMPLDKAREVDTTLDYEGGPHDIFDFGDNP